MHKFTAVLGVVALAGWSVASAATTVTVTPTNPEGWSTADTRPGGSVTFVSDPTAPGAGAAGALRLATDMTTTAKAQYMHEADTELSDVTELSYWTKQLSGPIHAAPSYQLAVDLNGDAAGGFTTLVYEPYQNGAVLPNQWQFWDVDQGQFWSSRGFTSGTCTIVAGGGGAPFYTLGDLNTRCPDAVVLGFGVNVGSNNPGYVVLADFVNFNGTIYDFEPYMVASNADQCKDGGYASVTDEAGNSFRNQGQCVAFVNSRGTPSGAR